ncbi:MAG: PAS domain S-box protein, partial [Tepidisphaeraceae bacterium]
MAVDSGMAFVLIQHLDPVHKSETASLLGHCTSMAVLEALDGLRIEANHVYVIPPNRALAIRKGRLRVSEPAEIHGRRMPIDFFFRSLAADYQERGIGVVFSGTGSDGTLGLQAIKGAGGLAIAQDPQTAEHEGMPRSAIASGVDLVLPVQDIPEALRKYAKHPYLRGPVEPATVSGQGRDQFQSILGLLRTRAKFDFGSYKRGTLQRRLQRRMSLRHVVRIGDYLNLLRHDENEAGALLKDLLISVTHFFREPEAWKVLQEQAVRPLIAGKSDDQAIRVWAPGCATGEEAYSIGMLLLDELSAAGKNCPINIFASDVNREAFTTARFGSYPECLAADVSPQRLRRYFVREGEHIRIRKELRDLVVFAEHNLLADPPFSHLDLISCRNLMIYLDPPAQKRVIALFHYALNEGGYLLLGNAETVCERFDLFRPVSRKWRLYRRIGPARSEPIQLPLDDSRAPSQPRITNPPQPAIGARFTEMAQQLILDRCAPTSVVINQKHEILYTCGLIQDYLKQPAGVMQTDLLRWVEDSLRSKLRAALKKAQTTDQAVILSDVRMRRGSSTSVFDITLEPLKAPRQAEGLILITFRGSKSTVRTTPTAPPSPANDESLVRQLEDELKNTREDLQSNIDQLAASNEELKASNEEVTSVNEELQSTNEEMETSKEELQSLNEELSTVNSQLQVNVEELETKTNDLNNLLSSTEIATIFLDRHFQIKWFTAPTTRQLNLRRTDMGRHIGDFAQKFTGEDLLGDADKVLHKPTPIEREIRGQDGCWYLRRVLPYRTADSRIDGVVITFVNIQHTKLAEEGVRRLATVLRDSNDAVTLQDFDGHILSWNHGAEIMFGFSEAEAKRLIALKLVPAPKRAEMRAILEQFKRGEKITSSLESQRITKDGRVIDVWLTVTPLLDEQGHAMGIATTERDITHRKQYEQTLRDSDAKHRAIFEAAVDGIITIDEHGTVESINAAAERLFGYPAEEVIGRNVKMFMPEPYHSQHNQYMANYLRTGQAKIIGIGREVRGRRKDGSTFPLDLAVSETRPGTRRVFTGIVRDITQKKRDEAALRELNESLEKRVADRSALAEQQAGRLRELAAQLLVTEEQERRNLAADLHDNLAQLLHVAKMKLSELRCGTDGDGREALFQEVEKLLGRANQSARSLSYQLSPPVLHELGLIPALEWLGEEMKRVYRL